MIALTRVRFPWHFCSMYKLRYSVHSDIKCRSGITGYFAGRGTREVEQTDAAREYCLQNLACIPSVPSEQLRFLDKLTSPGHAYLGFYQGTW